jgi:hypothetical protein
MDIGLGEFLKMFEERFGRTATTILLAMIGLGVMAFMLSLIWEHLIVPLYSFSGSLMGAMGAHPLSVSINWTTAAQIGLTVLQFFTIAFVIVVLATMVMMVMREVVFDYWGQVFWKWKIARKARQKEREASKSENP